MRNPLTPNDFDNLVTAILKTKLLACKIHVLAAAANKFFQNK